MGLSHTVSEIDGEFSPKSQKKFSPPLYFVPPLKGFPLQVGSGAGGHKTRTMGYRAEKEIWRYLQPFGWNTPTWQTEGRSDRQTNRHRATAKTTPPSSMENISCLQTALSAIADWISNLLCFNSAKTEFLLLGLKPQLNKIHDPALTLSNGASVCPSPSARNLGFIFDAHLTFSDHISSLACSCFYHIRDLRRIRPVLDFSTAHTIGTSLVHSKLITATHCTMVFQKPS